MRRILAWALATTACTNDTAAGDPVDAATTDGSSASGIDSTTTSSTAGMSSTSGSTSADGSSSTDTSGDMTTGEPLPCDCAPGEVCVEMASDACSDPPTPIVSCSQSPPSCDGVAFSCDSPCGWDTCGGPGCLGAGVEVCGVPSEGIVCARAGSECNLFAQLCPRGEKCTSWDSDADQIYDASRCVPILDAAVPVGGVCTFEGDRFSGIDDCALGAKCLPENLGDPTGICRAACSGSPFEASCADPAMTCALDGHWFAWCLPP